MLLDFQFLGQVVHRVDAKSALLRFHLAMKTAPAPLRLLFPADPLRWAPPGVAAFAAGLLDLQFLG